MAVGRFSPVGDAGGHRSQAGVRAAMGDVRALNRLSPQWYDLSNTKTQHSMTEGLVTHSAFIA